MVEIADELLKLAGLRDSGVLTEQEFTSEKAKLLAHDAPPQELPAVVKAFCAKCKARTEVSGDSVRFDCAHCQQPWRVVQCPTCKWVGHAPEEVGAWKCPTCSTDYESYWKTTQGVKCKCGTSNQVTKGAATFVCSNCGKQHFRCSGCGTYSRLGFGVGRRWPCTVCKTFNQR